MPMTKRDSGWKAEDIFDFDGPRRLCISTYKINGKLVSNASVNKYGDGMCVHAFGLGSGGDWSRYVIQTPGARGTEKAIAAQHAQALAMLPHLMAEARAHYVKFPARD